MFFFLFCSKFYLEIGKKKEEAGISPFLFSFWPFCPPAPALLFSSWAAAQLATPLLPLPFSLTPADRPGPPVISFLQPLSSSFSAAVETARAGPRSHDPPSPPAPRFLVECLRPSSFSSPLLHFPLALPCSRAQRAFAGAPSTTARRPRVSSRCYPRFSPW